MFPFRRGESDPSPSIVRLARNLVSDVVRLARVEVDLVKAGKNGNTQTLRTP